MSSQQGGLSGCRWGESLQILASEGSNVRTLQAPFNAGDLLIICNTISVSRSTLLYGGNVM
jgi:hypothetical protein